ncbi:MAG: hypothetical protein V4677_05040 [Bacteroidota bacterium]
MKIKTLAIVGAQVLLLNKTYAQFTTNGSPYNTTTQVTGGNVGIQSPSATPPTDAFQIGDRFVFHNGGYKYFGYNTKWGGAYNIRMAANDYASLLGFGNGDLNFETAPYATTAGVQVTTTTKFIVKNAGEVGIGTATPDAGKMLTVVGTGVNTQIAKFADNARYIGLGRDEVAAYDVTNGNVANLYLGGGGGKLAILTNSNIGMGAPTPYKRLTVNGDVSFANPAGSTGGNSGFEIVGNGQIPSRRGISVDNDPSGKFNFYIHQWQTNAGFYFKEGLNNKTLVSIMADGKVRIGTLSPTAPHTDALLAVDGKVACKSLYVLKTTSWADFVFKRKELENLADVEQFINKNKHLPGIPSEEEVLANGYDINEMDAKLLEKIETLYLHIISLEKEIKDLKNK